jgi:hypothetical protein
MDTEIFVRHCIDAGLIVGCAAPTVWAGLELWKGKPFDTKKARDAFRLFGTLFIVFVPVILSPYIAPEHDRITPQIFPGVAWFLFAVPVLRLSRKLFVATHDDVGPDAQ